MGGAPLMPVSPLVVHRVHLHLDDLVLDVCADPLIHDGAHLCGREGVLFDVAVHHDVLDALLERGGNQLLQRFLLQVVAEGLGAVVLVVLQEDSSNRARTAGTSVFFLARLFSVKRWMAFSLCDFVKAVSGPNLQFNWRKASTP